MLGNVIKTIRHETDLILINFKWYRRWQGGAWYLVHNTPYGLSFTYWTSLCPTSPTCKVIAVDDYNLRKA